VREEEGVPLFFLPPTHPLLLSHPSARLPSLTPFPPSLPLCPAAENETHEGKRKCEALWPIFKISHQRSRYIFDLYYRRKAISKELYQFCVDQKYADQALIAKWRKVRHRASPP